MKNWILKQGYGLLSLCMVFLVGLGTILGGQLIAPILERMPGLIYMYTEGKAPETVREEVEPLPLERVGIDATTIQALSVPVRSEPTVHELDTSAILPSGHYLMEASANAIFSARQAVWRWDAAEEGLGVSVIVIELPTNAWAQSVMNILDLGDENAPSRSYPQGARVTHEVGAGEEPYDIAGVAFVHNRLLISLEIGVGPDYMRAAEDDPELVFDPAEVAQSLAFEVDSNLPDLHDLEGWETVPVSDVRPLHAGTLGAAATLVLLIRSLGMRLLDRGSREAMVGPIRRRYITPRTRDIDLRKTTRSLRIKTIMRDVGVAVLIGICIIVLYFVSGTMGLIPMFLLVGAFFILASSVLILINRLKTK